MSNTNKKYQVIYSDPPWKMHNKIFHMKKEGGGKFDHVNLPKEELESLSRHYPTMETADICRLPIKDIADRDCALFMWTTDSHLPDALEVIKSWGFTYRTIAFVWRKLSSNGNARPLWAPWTLKETEICLFAARGNMRQYKKDGTIRAFLESVNDKHSAKPQEIADRIVKMFPNVNRIELFARDAKPNWDIWGNELENDIEL